MYPGINGSLLGEKPAYIMASTGESVSHSELNDRSNKLAQFLREKGLGPGDSIALCMENNVHFLEITWAAQRSGLYYTPISSRMGLDEVAYIVNDCNAKVFIVSQDVIEKLSGLPELCPKVDSFLVCDSAGNPANKNVLQSPMVNYEDTIAKYPNRPIDNEIEGSDLLYSSGTTGKPKGVRLVKENQPIGTPDAVVMLLKFLYQATDKSTYLTPAPLYHAAPLRFTMAFTRIGGTVIIMDHFEPTEYLSLVGRYQVTHTQLVPTMFVRMLKLDEQVRKSFDVSCLKCAIHASAPCPTEIKREMINWWGPVLYEYYAGTESNGFVACNSQEWLAHPGTVGKSLLGTIHITDEEENELAIGEDGTIWFEMDGQGFEYLNDAEKTSGSRSKQGWTTLGDVGHLDSDGFLYLTDRKAYMIISGGVNIYPQECENELINHPKVLDCAVFGIPDSEMGEQVKAVVELLDPTDASEELKTELLQYCRSKLAHYKCPKTIDFTDQLPRYPNGKLYKRLLRDPYWKGRTSKII